MKPSQRKLISAHLGAKRGRDKIKGKVLEPKGNLGGGEGVGRMSGWLEQSVPLQVRFRSCLLHLPHQTISFKHLQHHLPHLYSLKLIKENCKD